MKSCKNCFYNNGTDVVGNKDEPCWTCLTMHDESEGDFPKWESADRFETIKIEPHPCQVGTSCMICDDFIPLGFGYYGSYIPTTRICDECKKRLKKILYKDGET